MAEPEDDNFDTIRQLREQGHSDHCAKRQVWGDGECECREYAKGYDPYSWQRAVKSKERIQKMYGHGKEIKPPFADYAEIKAERDRLAAEVEKLKKENEFLQSQLSKHLGDHYTYDWIAD